MEKTIRKKKRDKFRKWNIDISRLFYLLLLSLFSCRQTPPQLSRCEVWDSGMYLCVPQNMIQSFKTQIHKDIDCFKSLALSIAPEEEIEKMLYSTAVFYGEIEKNFSCPCPNQCHVAGCMFNSYSYSEVWVNTLDKNSENIVQVKNTALKHELLHSLHFWYLGRYDYQHKSTNWSFIQRSCDQEPYLRGDTL